MVTRTALTSRGQLRHGHPMTPHDYAYGGGELNWHAADTYHAEAPDIHTTHSAYTEPNWTMRGEHWELTPERRDALIRDAEASHNRKRSAAEAVAASSLARPPTPATDLVERIDNAEKLTILAHRAAGDATNKARLVDERVDSVEASLSTTKHELSLSAARVRELDTRITKLEETPKAQTLHIYNHVTDTHTTSERHHFMFPLLLKYAKSLPPERRNIWISGPAGGGKTSAVEQVAKVLGLEFRFNGAIDTGYKLTGYMTPTGEYVSTHFRYIYENGGVYLLDEIDASNPNAVLELNAPLANGWAPFPDKMVKRHLNAYIFAGGNTWGFGGDANYVGRFKQDAAFLNRFVKVYWPYDPTFERVLAGDDEWVDVVQAVRAAAVAHQAKIVVSPRSSILGADLIRGGLTPREVVDGVFGDLRNTTNWNEIGKAAEAYALKPHTTLHTAREKLITAIPAEPRVTAAKLPTLDMSNMRVYSR